MRKGVNIWSFDQNKSIAECMALGKAAGFESIELALSADGELGMESGDPDAIAEASRRTGMPVNSVATGLYWQYSFTSAVPERREKAMRVALRQLDAAQKLGADTVLVCPGHVGIDFRPSEVVPDAEHIECFAGDEVVDYEIAWERALSALRRLAPEAEKRRVKIGVENIWNKFLLSPLEMRAFLDAVGSDWVGAFVDVGNMMPFGYPEQWIRILGKRIVKVHFKDFRLGNATLAGFVDLLAGDVNWPGVMRALKDAGYDGFVNAEMCPTYRYHTDSMIYNASRAMDAIFRG